MESEDQADQEENQKDLLWKVILAKEERKKTNCKILF